MTGLHGENVVAGILHTVQAFASSHLIVPIAHAPASDPNTPRRTPVTMTLHATDFMAISDLKSCESQFL
jgi:hypothetical protein